MRLSSKSSNLNQGVIGKRNLLSIHLSEEINNPVFDKEWRPVAFPETQEINPTDVVFAGYGLVAPKAGKHKEYDSYVHLDVKDKWVAKALRYVPGGC